MCCFHVQLKRGFTNDIDIIGQVVRGLGPSGSYPRCDLSELFRMAAAEAPQSNALNRRLRVVIFHSTLPVFGNSISRNLLWSY
jgi:hypothetical protein